MALKRYRLAVALTLIVVGTVAIVVGVAAIFWPAAPITGGVLALAAGALVDLGDRPQPQPAADPSQRPDAVPMMRARQQ